VLFLALATAGPAHAEPSGAALRAIRAGQWRQAAELLREDSERDPDDPETATRLGMVYAQLGYLPDAAATLAFAEGAERYERRALGAHACVLRELGEPERAADLRLASLLAAESETDEVTVWLETADDRLAAGDIGGAEEAALAALAIEPRSPWVHAWLADIARLDGDLDEAGFHLWLSALDGVAVPRAAEVQARIALAEGAVVEALSALSEARRRRSRSAPLALLQAEIYRRIGWTKDAEALLTRDRMYYGERLDYLATLAAVRLDQGRRAEACSLAARAPALYPSRREPVDLARRAGCP
jgi:predicted Zn-dependent protease